MPPHHRSPKSNAPNAIMKTPLLCLAWIALCSSIVGLFVGIDLDLNFFSWIGTWSFQSVACMTGILILLIATCFLAGVSQKTPVSVVARVSCVLLIGVGLWAIAPEELGSPGQWLSRSRPSPDWYRWGRLAIACTPLCIFATMPILCRRRQDRAA